MQFGKLATVFGLAATAAASPIAQRDLLPGVKLPVVDGLAGDVQQQLTGCVASVTSGLGLAGHSPIVGDILQGVKLPLVGRDSTIEAQLNLPGLSPEQLTQTAQGLQCLSTVLQLPQHVAGEAVQVKGIAQEKLQPLLSQGTELFSSLGAGQIIGLVAPSKRDGPIPALGSGLPLEILAPAANPLMGLIGSVGLTTLLGGATSILGLVTKLVGI